MYRYFDRLYNGLLKNNNHYKKKVEHTYKCRGIISLLNIILISMHAHCQTCLPQTLIILSAQVYNKITRRNIKIDLRIYNRKLYCVKAYQHI